MEKTKGDLARGNQYFQAIQYFNGSTNSEQKMRDVGQQDIYLAA
jgi:hypothetical protein